MKIADTPKIITKTDGTDWVYCPDCGTYIPYYNEDGEMNFPKWRKREIGTYCRRHHAARQAIRNPIYYEKHFFEIKKQQKEYKIRTGRIKSRSEVTKKRMSDSNRRINNEKDAAK